MIKALLNAAARQLGRDVARNLSTHPHRRPVERDTLIAGWHGLTPGQWVALTARERADLRAAYHRGRR